MPNAKQVIDSHNKALILKKAETAQPQQDEGKTCNCRKKEDCPLNGTMSGTKSRLQPVTRKRHTSVSRQRISRQDTETTRCHLDTKREEMRLSSVSTCGS